MNIPAKAKIFMWKAAHDIIATEANLAAHHVPVNQGAPFVVFIRLILRMILSFASSLKRARRTQIGGLL